MPADPETITAFIERELGFLSDERVRAQVRDLLVTPRLEMRDWDYGDPGQQYPCWIVLDDGLHPGTGIAYCEHGFGPKEPWGLVLSGDADGQSKSMGMDSQWFPTFLDAFFESFAATSLPIWRVFTAAGGAQQQALTEELSWEDAWQQCEAARRADPNCTYAVHQTVHKGDG